MRVVTGGMCVGDSFLHGFLKWFGVEFGSLLVPWRRSSEATTFGFDAKGALMQVLAVFERKRN